MENNDNVEKKENIENSADTKEEKKGKKGKKPKKEKKVYPKFSEIDITTATEDDIIQSGIRDNVKSDIICYCLMGLIVVFILIPPALRLFIPKPITEEEREIVYTELTCYRTIARDGYELNSMVKGNYRDGQINTMEIEHAYKRVLEDAPEEYSFAEINEFLAVGDNVKGYKIKKSNNKYNFVVNFHDYPNLKNDELLSNYSPIYGVEINYLSGQGYYCSTKTEVVEELVYVDTGDKVED